MKTRHLFVALLLVLCMTFFLLATSCSYLGLDGSKNSTQTPFSDKAQTTFALSEDYTITDKDCDDKSEIISLNLEELQLNSHTLDLNGKTLSVKKDDVCTVKIQNGSITNGNIVIDVPNGDIDFTDLILTDSVQTELTAAPETVRFTGVKISAVVKLKGSSRLIVASSTLQKLSVVGNAIVEANDGTNIESLETTANSGSNGSIKLSSGCRITAMVLACPMTVNIAGEVGNVDYSVNDLDNNQELPSLTLAEGGKLKKLHTQSPMDLNLDGEVEELSLSNNLPQGAKKPTIVIRVVAVIRVVVIKCPVNIDVAGKVDSIEVSEDIPTNELPSINVRDTANVEQFISYAPVILDILGKVNNLSLSSNVAESSGKITIGISAFIADMKVLSLTDIDVIGHVSAFLYNPVMRCDKLPTIHLHEGGNFGNIVLKQPIHAQLDGIVENLIVDEFTFDEEEEQPQINIGKKAKIETADICAKIALAVEGTLRALNLDGLADGANIEVLEDANVITVIIYVPIEIVVYGQVEALMVDEKAQAKQDLDMNIKINEGSKVNNLCLGNTASVLIDGIVQMLSVATFEDGTKAPSLNVGKNGTVNRAEVRNPANIEISGKVPELVLDKNAEQSILALLTGAVIDYLIADIEDLQLTADVEIIVEFILLIEEVEIEIPASLLDKKMEISREQLEGYTAHSHYFVEKERTDSTCQVAGSVTKTCICGETKVEELLLLEHEFEVFAETPATCTTEGEIVYHCACCGEEKRVTTEMIAHQFEITEKSDATCTENGYVVRTCSYCNKTERVDTAMSGHNYVITSVTNATCTQDGVIVYTCEHCSHSYSVTTVGEHSYTLTETVAPTCQQAGYQLFTCENCQATKRIDIETGAGHIFQRTVVQRATSEQEGIYKYKCENCDEEYTVTIPCRQEGNYILLIQDTLPWTEDNNVELLNRLVSEEYLTGWDMMTSKEVADSSLEDLEAYTVIYIANDQKDYFYNNLENANKKLSDYVENGGTVVYGACDHGWQSGNISYALLGGVTKHNRYALNNYIYNEDNFIVTGELTDYQALTDALLKGTYCSHTAFDSDTLPQDCDIILVDNTGSPTLVQFALGKGNVILSGLTWEFYYHRSFEGDTTYSKCVYDDLLVYSLALSNGKVHIHEFDLGTEIEPTCSSEGGVLHTCLICGKSYFTDKKPALTHDMEEIKRVEPTCSEDGYIITRCKLCGEEKKTAITSTGHNYTVVVNIQPTSIMCGSATATCYICGNTFQIILPKLEQSGKYEIVTWTSPDCVNEGVHQAIYNYRGLKIEVEERTEKLGHNFSSNQCTRCGLKTSTFSGNVYIADGDTNISNNSKLIDAQIVIEGVAENGESFSFTTTADSSGYYELKNLPYGNYTVKVSKDGYFDNIQTITIRMPVQQNEPLSSVSEGNTSPAQVSGTVKNAVNGNIISGITVLLRAGTGTVTGDVIRQTTTNSSGYYSFSNIAPGNYTIQFTDKMEYSDEKARFGNATLSLALISNANLTGQNAMLSNSLSLNANSMRIVLSWGSSPRDLDSHLTYGSSEVYYGNKNSEYVKLDTDCTSGYGPETITISNILDNTTYTYYVYNWSGGNISSSSAIVKVFLGDSSEAYYTFYVPSGSGRYWHVFSYNKATGFTIQNYNN